MPYSKGLERSSWGSGPPRARVTVTITKGYATLDVGFDWIEFRKGEYVFDL